MTSTITTRPTSSTPRPAQPAAGADHGYRVDVEVRELQPSIHLAGVVHAGAADAIEVLLRPLALLPNAVHLDAAEVSALDPDGFVPVFQDAARRAAEHEPPLIVDSASPVVRDLIDLVLDSPAAYPLDLSARLTGAWPR